MLYRNVSKMVWPFRHHWPNAMYRNSSKDVSIEPEKRYLAFNDIPAAAVDPSPIAKFWGKISQVTTGSWKRFHEHIDDRHRRLGPIFREPLGPIEAVFVNSPTLLRDVFAYEGKYPKHPLPEAWTFYNQLHNCKRGLFFMDDDEWLQTRKQLAPLMLRNDDRFLWAIERASAELVATWKRNSSRADFTEMPDMLNTLYHWSIMVLIRIMFGRHVSEKIIADAAPLIAEFATTVQNVFEDTVPFMSLSPQLARKFNLKIWTRFERSVHQTLSIASRIIDYGVVQGKSDGLLSDMLQLGMSDDMIKRIFIDLIVAAGDTTAFSTQWALYLLSRNAAMQQLVRDELLAASGQHETPLIRGTVREALRMFPVATFIGRILGKDAILNGYRVDKHTLVLISMYSAGRDETSFPEANRFLPWRWNRHPSTGALKYVNHAQSSIPYALGARNCIGQRIANAQMHVLLASILRSFEVQLINGKEVDLVMRLIIMPKEKLRFGVKTNN